MKFGDRLKKLRKSKPDLSQKKFGERLGLAESTISMYEQNRREPDYETLIKIADFFDVSIDYLIRGESKESQEKIFTNEAKRILDSKEATITPLDGDEVTDEMIGAALEILAEQLKNRRKPGDVKSGKYPSKKSDDEG